jgi:hypothetical protein
VTELADVLVGAGYRPENVRLLTQSKARQADDDRYRPEGENIRQELKLLLGRKAGGDSVLVALAGHGVQPRGGAGHFFCPMDARLDRPETLIALEELYRELEGCQAGVNLLFVDACRNDPFADNSRAAAVQSVTRPRRPAASWPCSVAPRGSSRSRTTR